LSLSLVTKDFVDPLLGRFTAEDALGVVVVQTDEHRQDVFEMRRTIADELMEEGATKAFQQTLIRQLKRRFGGVPDEVTAVTTAAVLRTSAIARSCPGTSCPKENIW